MLNTMFLWMDLDILPQFKWAKLTNHCYARLQLLMDTTNFYFYIFETLWNTWVLNCLVNLQFCFHWCVIGLKNYFILKYYFNSKHQLLGDTVWYFTVKQQGKSVLSFPYLFCRFNIPVLVFQFSIYTIIHFS